MCYGCSMAKIKEFRLGHEGDSGAAEQGKYENLGTSLPPFRLSVDPLLTLALVVLLSSGISFGVHVDRRRGKR